MRIADLLRLRRDPAPGVSTERLEEFRDHAAENGLDTSREHYDYILDLRARRSRDHGAAPLAALLVSLVAFTFCVFASTLLKWVPSVTGPLAAVSAVALIASGVWLNRWAGRGDEDEDEDGPECPYDSCHHNHPERGRGEQ